MKCIGFIGKADKTELVGYISRIIASTGRKVIMLDATVNQKTRYTIPTIDDMESQSQYVVQHDNVEVAVGFSNMLELKKYLLSKGEDFNSYDFVLVDTDQEEMIEEYDLKSANINFFVTSYDKWCIHKGIELLRFLCALKRRTDPEGKINVHKVLYFSDINTADSKYIERISDNLPISWEGAVLNFPYDQGDLSVNIQNQYSNKFDIRPLSKTYKETLAKIVEVIAGEQMSNVKKIMKNVEKVTKFSI